MTLDMRTTNRILQKGFTLIELLVVIGILSILVVGLIVAINPQDKLRQANDSRVINDVGAMSRAMESYATANNGAYPAALTGLAPSELKAVPTPPDPTNYGNAYTYNTTNAPCAVATPCVIGQLRATSNIAKSVPAAGVGATNVFQKFESSTGKTCIVPAVTTACP